MGRYGPTGPSPYLAKPRYAADDTGFFGVNNRLDPSQLDPGIGSEAVNKRFTRGVAGDRKGIRKLNWLNRAGTGRTIQPYTTIWGTGKFRDPNGVEWDVVAADGQVYLCREQQYPVALSLLPPGITVNAPVTFTQAFNVLIMFRGEALSELQMERIEEGFKLIDQQPNIVTGADSENPIDGTEPIPNATRGLFFQNRLFIPYGKDLVGVSDYLNYTRYSPVLSAFRINQGSSDALVTLGRFNETTLIAFKEQSIYAISNLTGDLSGATLYEITSEYGCKAAKSVVAVGKDLWFLADKRGICSITLTEQNKIQGVDVPVSLDIQKTIDRINWRYADQAVAAYWQNRFYLAVPLDAAEVVKRNVIPAAAVYDTHGGWVMTGTVAGRRYRWTKAGADSGLAVRRNIQQIDYLAFPVGYNLAVIAGKTYRWTGYPGSGSTSLVNGTDTYLASAGPRTFVAQGGTVVLHGSGIGSDGIDEVITQTGDFTALSVQVELLGGANAGVSARLQPLFQGVNNAVLVYDFLNQKWSGYDQSVALQVKDWSLATVQGRQRLIFFSHDGFLNLYEEGEFDEDILAEQPYATEVRVLAAPAPGFSLQLEGDVPYPGGATITATLAANNAGNNWAIGNPASASVARANFWAGYDPSGASPWSAPKLDISRMSQSVVRFRSWPSGLLGTADRFADPANEPGVLLEDVARIYFEPIVSIFISRGYLCDTLKPKSFLRLTVDWATLNPSVSIDLLTEGSNEVFNIVANRTRNRLKYYRPQYQPDFAPDNHNGDYQAPFRQDYAWILGPTDMIYLDTKIDPEAVQEMVERFWASGRGKYAQVRLTNTQGRLELKSLSLEAVLASERLGVQA